MDGLLTLLIFIGVIALTALIFGVWIVTTLVRTALNGVRAIFLPTPAASRSQPVGAGTRGIVCTNAGCRATNPETARFCRRCGAELPQAQQVNVRRRVAIF
jgi:uncharacterized paraquat-inducible protein A